MTNENKTNKKTNRPTIKCRFGIWQLAIWIKKKTIPVKSDYDVERTVTNTFCLLSGGVLNNGKWKNIEIPFRLSQFANLKQCIDDVAEQLKEMNSSSKETVDVDDLLDELENKGGEE
jgi:hypothetical protein